MNMERDGEGRTLNSRQEKRRHVASAILLSKPTSSIEIDQRDRHRRSLNTAFINVSCEAFGHFDSNGGRNRSTVRLTTASISTRSVMGECGSDALVDVGGSFKRIPRTPRPPPSRQSSDS